MFAVDGLFKILDYEILISFNAFGRYFFISAFPLLGKALLRFLFNVSISEICQTLTMNHECIVEILYNIIVGVISIAPTIIIAIRIRIIAIIVFTIFLNIFFNSDSCI